MKIESLQAINPSSGRRVSVHVTLSAQRQARRGHPWLFDRAITRQSHDGAAGDLAVVYDNKGKFLAVGLYDPHSPIRVRLLQHRKPADIGREWFAARVRAAAQLRKPVMDTDTDGYRLIHGENDGLPGLVADIYAGTLVVKIYTAAWVPHLGDVLPALTDAAVERIVLRMSRICRERPEALYGLEDGQLLFGPPLDGPVVFRENGLLFEADPLRGQKTGFFLDQRENRARVEALAAGTDVLNVFSYTGGFSLYAARGGARSVTSVDLSRPAIAAAKRNFELNADDVRVAECAREYVVGDAFEVMARLATSGKNYDMVIIDPPSFAKKPDEIAGALQAYSKLVELGLGVLRKGGTLVMASCSSRVGAGEFFDTVLASANRAGRRLAEIERAGHAVDHPIGFPEGEYLKCLFARG